jgi:enoyl-CoA hydratase/carnithine racemase
MTAATPSSDPTSDLLVHRAGHVATVEMCRPPHNFFDLALISKLAEAFESLQADPQCRAIVLAAQGSSFCAGANFSEPGGADHASRNPGGLYRHAVRLFEVTKPVIAAVHGPAIGGGLGLALVADFRVTCAEARFSANFARLGFPPGFGLSHTLPRLVGPQKAALLFYTGRRMGGEEAVRIGLADELVTRDEVRARAQALAGEIAASAPIAVESVRATLRRDLADAVRAAVEHEAGEQRQHFQTRDFREGIAATAQRREPVFQRM